MFPKSVSSYEDQGAPPPSRTRMPLPQVRPGCPAPKQDHGAPPPSKTRAPPPPQELWVLRKRFPHNSSGAGPSQDFGLAPPPISES